METRRSGGSAAARRLYCHGGLHVVALTVGAAARRKRLAKQNKRRRPRTRPRASLGFERRRGRGPGARAGGARRIGELARLVARLLAPGGRRARGSLGLPGEAAKGARRACDQGAGSWATRPRSTAGIDFELTAAYVLKVEALWPSSFYGGIMAMDVRSPSNERPLVILVDVFLLRTSPSSTWGTSASAAAPPLPSPPPERASASAIQTRRSSMMEMAWLARWARRTAPTETRPRSPRRDFRRLGLGGHTHAVTTPRVVPVFNLREADDELDEDERAASSLARAFASSPCAARNDIVGGASMRAGAAYLSSAARSAGRHAGL